MATQNRPMIFARRGHAVIVSYDPQRDGWAVVCKGRDYAAMFRRRKNARRAAKEHRPR